MGDGLWGEQYAKFSNIIQPFLSSSALVGRGGFTHPLRDSVLKANTKYTES